MISIQLFAEILPALSFGEFLDGIAECRAGHGTITGVFRVRLGMRNGTVMRAWGEEEGFQTGFVALPGFTEEPADGFLYEVVRVMQEDVGNREGVVQLSMTDERHGADDADALLPDSAAFTGKVVEESAVFVQKPLPQQRVTRQVHQVPVVNVVGVG